MRTPGLRARVTLLVGAGALVLTAALSVATYEVTAQHLVDERERTAVRGAYFDAAVVRQGVVSDGSDIVTVLRSLDTGQSRTPLLHRDDRWYSRTADEGITDAVPARLQELVQSEQPAVQRIRLAGETALVVGVPLAGSDADYYEVQSLNEVQSTLRTLAGTLVLVALVATTAAVLLSRWVSGRALRPLREVVGAATRVSSGDLSARMRPAKDPDLVPLSQAFNAMVTEVSARIDRDRRFAADVSHELRSPLQTLTAASSVLMRSRERLDERTAAAAQLVADEAGRFTALVQDLLLLAQADTPVRWEPTDVTALVHRAAERSGVTPDLVDVADVPLWPMDGGRIEQALVNLLDNARRHGGGVTAVTVGVVDDQLLFTVDDSGPGVPPDERELIFDRFARGRAAHTRGDGDGTGLGLPLVAQYAAAHGGRIEVLDRPGGGGRFRISLPRDAAGVTPA